MSRPNYLSIRLLTASNAPIFINQATSILKLISVQGEAIPSTFVLSIVNPDELNQNIVEQIDSRYDVDKYIIGHFLDNLPIVIPGPTSMYSTYHFPCPSPSDWSAKYSSLWTLTPHRLNNANQVVDTQGNIAPNVSVTPTGIGIKSVYILSLDVQNPHHTFSPCAITALLEGNLLLTRESFMLAQDSLNSRTIALAKSLKAALHDVIASAFLKLCKRCVRWLLNIITPTIFMALSTSSTPPFQNYMETILVYSKRLIDYFRSNGKDDNTIFELTLDILTDPDNSNLKKITAGCQDHMTQAKLHDLTSPLPLHLKLDTCAMRVAIDLRMSNNPQLSALDALVEHITPLGLEQATILATRGKLLLKTMTQVQSLLPSDINGQRITDLRVYLQNLPYSDFCIKIGDMSTNIKSSTPDINRLLATTPQSGKRPHSQINSLELQASSSLHIPPNTFEFQPVLPPTYTNQFIRPDILSATLLPTFSDSSNLTEPKSLQDAVHDCLVMDFSFNPSSNKEQLKLYEKVLPASVYAIAIEGITHANKNIEISAKQKATRLSTEICFKALFEPGSCTACQRQHPSKESAINLVNAAISGSKLGPFPKLPIKWLKDNMGLPVAKAYGQLLKTLYEQGKLKILLEALKNNVPQNMNNLPTDTFPPSSVASPTTNNGLPSRNVHFVDSSPSTDHINIFNALVINFENPHLSSALNQEIYAQEALDLLDPEPPPMITFGCTTLPECSPPRNTDFVIKYSATPLAGVVHDQSSFNTLAPDYTSCETLIGGPANIAVVSNGFNSTEQALVPSRPEDLSEFITITNGTKRWLDRPLYLWTENTTLNHLTGTSSDSLALTDGPPPLFGASSEGRFTLASSCPDAPDSKTWTEKYLAHDPHNSTHPKTTSQLSPVIVPKNIKHAFLRQMVYAIPIRSLGPTTHEYPEASSHIPNSSHSKPTFKERSNSPFSTYLCDTGADCNVAHANDFLNPNSPASHQVLCFLDISDQNKYGNLSANGIGQGGITFSHLAFIIVRTWAFFTDSSGQHIREIEFGINVFLSPQRVSNFDLIIGDSTLAALGITIAPHHPDDLHNRVDNRIRLPKGTLFSCIPHPLLRDQALKIIKSPTTPDSTYNKAALTLSFRPHLLPENYPHPPNCFTGST